MVFKDNNLFMSFDVMGGGIQPQGHVQVWVNIIDLGMGLLQGSQAIGAKSLIQDLPDSRAHSL